MKKAAILIAAVAILAVAATTKDAAAQTIRVAGYEILLDGETNREQNREQNRNRNRHRNNLRNWNYSGRIAPLEVGFNQLRTWEHSYSAYPIAEKGFMELDIARSVNVTLNLSTFSSALTRGNWLGISMAVGVTYNQYTLDTPVGFVKWEKMLHPVETGYFLKRSKLRSLALHVPMVLEINPTRNFFVAAGGYADVVLWSDAKWKMPKEKLPSPYINFFQMGLTARVGFRDLYVFGNYSIGELFKPGRGPRLNPYTFGLGFGF
jgi:hypothetical protein